MLKRLYSWISLLLFFLMPANSVSAEESRVKQKMKQKVFDYLMAAYKISPDDLEVNYIKFPNDNFDKYESCRFLIRTNTDLNKLRNKIVWIEIFEKKMHRKSVPVKVSIALYRPVLITKLKISRGQMITGERIKLVKYRYTGLLNEYLSQYKNVIGMEAKYVLKSGTPIKRSMLSPSPVLRKGSTIDVQYRTGDLLITTRGIAKESGVIGDMIKIKCEPAGKNLTGVVQSNSLVVIREAGKI